MTRTIDRRTGYKAVFYPTTKLSLPPKPIAKISENFHSSQADQRDFFHVREFNAIRAEVYLAVSMPGTTQEEMHASLKNTLRQYSLWLTSKELSAKIQVWIGYIRNANPTYTDSQGQETRIQEEIINLAEVNQDAARSLDKIIGEQFIYCRSGKMFRWNNVIGEGISIFITSNNY